MRAHFDDFGGRQIYAGNGDRDLPRIGRLPDPKFVYDLRDFVKAARRLKDRYKTR